MRFITIRDVRGGSSSVPVGSIIRVTDVEQFDDGPDAERTLAKSAVVTGTETIWSPESAESITWRLNHDEPEPFPAPREDKP